MSLAKIFKVPIKNYFLNRFFYCWVDPAGRGRADGGGEEGHHAEEGGRGVDGDQRDFQVILFSLYSIYYLLLAGFSSVGIGTGSGSGMILLGSRYGSYFRGRSRSGSGSGSASFSKIRLNKYCNWRIFSAYNSTAARRSKYVRDQRRIGQLWKYKSTKIIQVNVKRSEPASDPD